MLYISHVSPRDVCGVRGDGMGSRSTSSHCVPYQVSPMQPLQAPVFEFNFNGKRRCTTPEHQKKTSEKSKCLIRVRKAHRTGMVSGNGGTTIGRPQSMRSSCPRKSVSDVLRYFSNHTDTMMSSYRSNYPLRALHLLDS